MLRLARRGLAPAALDDVVAVASAEDLRAARAEVDATEITEEVVGYVVAIVRRTRELPSVTLGASPRAAVHLLGAAKAAARLAGRAYVTPDDVSRMAAPVLRHRLVLTPEAELERATPAGAIRTALEDVPVPADDARAARRHRPRRHRAGGAARPDRRRRAGGARARRGGRSWTPARPSVNLRSTVRLRRCCRAESLHRSTIRAPAPAGGTVRVRQPAPPELTIEPREGDGGLQRDRDRHAARPAHAARRSRRAPPARCGSPAGTTRRAAPVELRVFPDLKTARRLALAVARGRFRDQGATARGPLGLGTEFELIRDYQPDDDIRQVNWRATARLGRPMSNQYRLEQDRDLQLLLDAGRLSAAPLGDAQRARRLPRRRRRARVRRRRARRPHRRDRLRPGGPDRAPAAPRGRAGGRARAVRPAAAPARQRLRGRVPPRRGLQARARRRLRRPARGDRRPPARRGRPGPLADATPSSSRARPTRR